MHDMIPLIEANWPIFAAVLVLALLIAWWIWGRGRGDERERFETPDVLTPGAAPAERNSLLVDAPPAAAFALAPAAGFAPDILGGVGEVIAAASAREIEDAADADTDRPAETAGAATPAGEPDDLSRIKGVGPKLNAMLRELGIRRYDQIAGWSEADIARIDPLLGPFQGRIERDNWVAQCRHLAAGDTAGYEAQFGKL